MSRVYTINSRYLDGTLRRSWECELIEESGSYLQFVGVFDRAIEHPHLGIIRPGTISYEYYWLDRWYNVFRFHEPDGTFRNYYCNINMPPEFKDGALDYVDLDIDVVVDSKGSVVVLDEDEFAQNSVEFKYPDHIKQQAAAALTELTRAIEQRKFPFDHLTLQQNTR